MSSSTSSTSRSTRPGAGSPASSAGDADSTRERLLRCARDVYLSVGIAGFSMRKVARQADLSATAIYRHFDSKEALLLAVTEEGFTLFARCLWRGLEGQSALDRLRLTGSGYLQFALEQTPYYRIIFMSPLHELGFDATPGALQRKSSPTFQFLVDRVRECIDAGDFVDDDPGELAATIWAQSHGLVALYLTGKLAPEIDSEADFTELFQRATARLFRGMRPA